MMSRAFSPVGTNLCEYLNAIGRTFDRAKIRNMNEQPFAVRRKFAPQRRIRQPLVMSLANEIWNDLDLVKIKGLDRRLFQETSKPPSRRPIAANRNA